MKQLIPQSKIDEAANEFSKNIRENSLSGSNVGKQQYQVGRKIGFSAGVQFTLNEIEPLMIEFAEFIISSTRIMNLKTTQQLLEEFINSKNKENE